MEISFYHCRDDVRDCWKVNWQCTNFVVAALCRTTDLQGKCQTTRVTPTFFYRLTSRAYFEDIDAANTLIVLFELFQLEFECFTWNNSTCLLKLRKTVESTWWASFNVWLQFDWIITLATTFKLNSNVLLKVHIQLPCKIWIKWSELFNDFVKCWIWI